VNVKAKLVHDSTVRFVEDVVSVEELVDQMLSDPDLRELLPPPMRDRRELSKLVAMIIHLIEEAQGLPESATGILHLKDDLSGLNDIPNFMVPRAYMAIVGRVLPQVLKMIPPGTEPMIGAIG